MLCTFTWEIGIWKAIEYLQTFLKNASLNGVLHWKRWEMLMMVCKLTPKHSPTFDLVFKLLSVNTATRSYEKNMNVVVLKQTLNIFHVLWTTLGRRTVSQLFGRVTVATWSRDSRSRSQSASSLREVQDLHMTCFTQISTEIANRNNKWAALKPWDWLY